MQQKISHSLSLIANAVDEYGDRIGVACSFGKDSMVTLHLCRTINTNIQVFSILTPYKPLETKQYGAIIARDWKLNLKVREAPIKDGGALYLEDVEKCCNYYKVEQFKKIIKELDLHAWISGLRRTEGTEHREKFTDEIESKGELIKINPILQWTEAEVWLYHAINNIPVHPLYTQGYRSLGCLPCSKPYTKEERGGRWEGTDKCGGECGIHTKNLT